jgi:glycosyltransferase involved in cell wall biosynthesis
MDAQKVTALVPVKDRREQMKRCLDALLAQDHPDYEVMVLDNGSTDGTYEMCVERARASRVPMRVERIDGTVGHVRNAGARLVETPIVAYTDSDCIPDLAWLRLGVRPFADPQVGVVCGRTEPENEPCAPWPKTIRVAEMTWRFESCNVLFRRASLTASDGFAEEGFPWEDAAAGWAVMRQGQRAAFAPDALVHHDVTYPGYGWHLRAAQQHRWAAPVIRRYPEARRALWAGVFLNRRHAELVLACVGLGLAVRRPAALVLAGPALWRRRPRRLSAGHMKIHAQATLVDAASVAGMVRGAVDARRVVM